MNTLMNTANSPLPEVPQETRLEEIQAQLKKLERRDWWLWAVAIIVMLLLTLAVVSLSFPGLMKTEDPIFQFSLNEAVRGLVGLVLLFNTYSIYQQVQIKRLRRQFSEQLQVMSRLKVRAEEFHRLATVDPLTGLYNRRFAETRLAAEASRSQRHGHPMTVVSFDLNSFKQINDQYGHPAGDQVLKEFAHDGVDHAQLASQLQHEGAESFTKSWRDLLDVIASKTAALASVEQKNAGRR